MRHKGEAPRDKYAWTMKIGERGQLVIPKEARDLFGFEPGDTIILLADKKRGIAIPPKSMFADLISKAFQGVMPDDAADGEEEGDA